MASGGVPSGGSNNQPPSLRVPSTSNPATDYRRLSYANVAAGSTAAAARTARLNALRRTAANESNAAAPSLSREESRGSMEVDNNNAAEDPLGWDGAGMRPKSSAPGGDGMGCLLHKYHHPFFIPSYLRRTRYAHMLRQQHDEHLVELRERNLPSSSSGPGQALKTPTSASSAYAKLAGSQLPRGVIQDIVDQIRAEDGEDNVERHKSLPSRWAENDAQPGLEILAEGSEVRFNGVTKTTDEAASVRSDFCMPKECGLYYFEVTVLSRSKDGLIGVGFSGSRVSLNRLPGWENDSWAYHGDDGYSFACTASGKSYGPKFASQDVVGCGVNFRTRSAFFTKNGVYLGVAFTNIRQNHELFPSVGMKRPGENLRVNFGQKPFVFDIDRLVEQERAAMMAEIVKADVQHLHPPDDERALIHNLVSQYFAHEGFVETAKAFVKDLEADRAGLDIGDSENTRPPIRQIDEEEDVHAFNRQKIRRAILDGDIDRALKFTNSFYPRVLEDHRNRDILFRLRCRKFIEMMRRYAEIQTSTSSGSHSPEQAMARSVQSLASNRGARIDPITAQNIGNDSAHPIEDTQMELDEQLHREIAPKSSTAGPGDEEEAIEEENEVDDEEDEDDDDEEDIDMDGGAPTTDLDGADHPSPKATLMKQHDLLTAALEYGQSLQSAFGNDPRPHVKKQLEDVFAIMAYTDPAASVVGGLLDPQGRTAIAEEVNGAILVSLGKPPSAAIERVIMQTEYMLDETARRDGGSTAFINARGDFLSP